MDRGKWEVVVPQITPLHAHEAKRAISPKSLEKLKAAKIGAWKLISTKVEKKRALVSLHSIEISEPWLIAENKSQETQWKMGVKLNEEEDFKIN